jgi:hypothetical protein
LKQLGVEHLYLFGLTARGAARDDPDVDLFFDHPLSSLGLFELMDVKAAARILGRKDRHHDAAQPASGSARTHRGFGGPEFLMPASSPVPRLTDIIEAGYRASPQRHALRIGDAMVKAVGEPRNVGF